MQKEFKVEFSNGGEFNPKNVFFRKTFKATSLEEVNIKVENFMKNNKFFLKHKSVKFEIV